MSKDIDFVLVTGTVVRVLQKHQYHVELDTGKVLFGQLNGRMASCKIWCSVGDKIQGEVSIYDLGKIRITKRL